MCFFDLPLAVRVSGLILAMQGAAYAQSTVNNVVLAQQRFRDGRLLASQGRCAEAVERFIESQSLDPAPGTLANLADCYDKLGETLAAWITYKETARLSLASGKPTWADTAELHARALEHGSPRVTLEVSFDAPEMSIELDAIQLPRSLWMSAPPMTAGTHEIQAKAAGRRPWSSRFDLREEGATVTVPDLEPTEARVPTTPASPSPPHVVNRASRPLNPQRIAAIATGGVSLAEIVAGVALISVSEATYARSGAECGTLVCFGDGGALRSRAIAELRGGALALVIGGATVGGAAVLWWGGANKLRVTASVGPSDIGVAFGGAW